MSGIYIKGMEMPTVRDTLVLVKTNGTAIVYEDEAYVTTVIPVPEHGRLIDADAAVVAIQNSIEVVHDGMQKILLDYAQKMFNATPTIIPASEEGEG